MAAELVGGALLSASLQFLFERIGSRDVMSYLRGKSKSCDFDELLGRLKLELNSVTSVLDDAEHKKMRKSKGVEAWLDELQEAFYEADDLLDEIETDALQSKVEAEPTATTIKVHKSRKDKVINFFTVSCYSKACFGGATDGALESEMKKILERLKYIAKQKDVLGLKEGGFGERPSSWRLPSTSLIEDSEFFGRDDDKEILIKLLLSNDVDSKSLCTIPIVGMCGVGKTTLAQAAFNDTEVKERFELKAWVCVSEDFDVSRVMKTVLRAVSGLAWNDELDLNSLQLELKERLSGSKFLIVLDDIWNENYVKWDIMCTPFKYGARGSKLIVTTRSEKVASIMGTVPIFYLKELTDEACWQLFAKHASGNGDFMAEPELKEIGKEIVVKCKGLPLAAKTLGGLLRSTINVGAWERILKSEIWDLTEEESNILPALRLSYHYLPSHLKRCFSYCSIFPKGYKFQKMELILLWMAENLLDNSKINKRMEDVGDEYFNDLVSRSIFQRSSADERPYFIMHDCVIDLAKFISGKYCIHQENDSSDKIVMKQARHFAYVIEPDNHYERFKSILEATHLRTFLPLDLQSVSDSYISKRVLPDLLLKCTCLRALSLCGYRRITELPDSIGELKHLRYLDLSYTSILQLPKSLSMLCNLQTLKLCHCLGITKLFEDFHRLINLRYLDVKGSNLQKMPEQIGKLKSLQMISTFIVGKDQGTTIGVLGEFSNLRGTLSITNLHNVVNSADASKAKLRDKKYIEELELVWDDACIEPQHQMDVLDNLLPNTALKKLHIKSYGGEKFPNWLSDQSFYNLVDLYLEGCDNCDSLPPLGQLSSLKTLQIRGFIAVETVGPEFYGESSSSVKPFASLECLRFYEMSQWKEWSMPAEDTEAFSKLKELIIVQCNNLIGDLPRHLPSLDTLRIDRCSKLDASLPEMPFTSKLELSDCGNLIRVNECHIIESFVCIQHLEITHYSDPMTLSCLPVTLKTLKIEKCAKFEFPVHHLHKSLEHLSIEGSFSSINGMFPLDFFPNIRSLSITNCDTLESLSVSDGLREDLESLSSLYLAHCYNLESFPKGGLPCPNLIKLNIKHCDKLAPSRKEWNLKGLSRLQSFVFHGSEFEHFPEEGMLPPTITYLEISDHPCIKELEYSGLRELTSLESLVLISCRNLCELPKQGLPTSLKFLEINRCPFLETKCMKKKGEYWHMIANIPLIRIKNSFLPSTN